MNFADHINQFRVANRDLDLGKRDFQRTTIRLEQTNYELRKEKERFEVEREAGTDEGAESLTESDEEGPSRKRKRGSTNPAGTTPGSQELRCSPVSRPSAKHCADWLFLGAADWLCSSPVTCAAWHHRAERELRVLYFEVEMLIFHKHTDLNKELVYVAYRDIFKDQLAKLRRPRKVRNVVEKHKDHLHHKQLADSIDSEKTCKILRDLLAARLFESKSAIKATFPTLFSHRELGNDTALTIKCVKNNFESEYRQRNRTNFDALPSSNILRFPDTPIPNSTFPKSAPTIR
ncbi:hypothetical protein BDZ45DRAFT_684889 [Acephala macrosclerotiorum]|nr:hypothetical protein BDZ45DRAFT_684889 [Acephala macrosclerotiorum]